MLAPQPYGVHTRGGETPGKKARDVGDQIVDFGGREGDLATAESGSYGGLSLNLRLREGVGEGGLRGFGSVWRAKRACGSLQKGVRLRRSSG